MDLRPFSCGLDRCGETFQRDCDARNHARLFHRVDDVIVCQKCHVCLPSLLYDEHCATAIHRQANKRARFEPQRHEEEEQRESDLLAESGMYDDGNGVDEEFVIDGDGMDEEVAEEEADEDIGAPGYDLNEHLIQEAGGLRVATFNEVQQSIANQSGDQYVARESFTGAYADHVRSLNLSNKQIRQNLEYLHRTFPCCGVCPGNPETCEHLPPLTVLNVPATDFIRIPILYNDTGEIVRSAFLMRICNIIQEWLVNSDILNSLCRTVNVEHCAFSSGKYFEMIVSITGDGAVPLCLTFYTDATQVVRMGQRSMWPIYLHIANSTLGQLATVRVAGFIPILKVSDFPEKLSKDKIRRMRLAVYHAVLHAVARCARMYDDQTGFSFGGTTFTPFVAGVKCDSKDWTKISGAEQSEEDCTSCDWNGSDAGYVVHEVRSFVARLAVVADSAEKMHNRVRAPAERRALKEHHMHLSNNFTRGLRAFDVAYNLGGCLLHICDINCPKGILKLGGRYLFKLRLKLGDGRAPGVAGRPRKDQELNVIDLVNAQLIRIGVTKKPVFDNEGKLIMTRKTGRDLRKMVWLFTFALIGVVQESDGGGELIDLLIAFHKVRTLCDAAVASDPDSVVALEVSIGPFMAAYDAAVKSIDEGDAKNVYAGKTLHQFSHFPFVVRYLGSLASTSSDQMERVHSFIKEIFETCTNGVLDEDSLMPQMAKSIVLRHCRPFPNASMVPGKAPAAHYATAKLVAPSNLQTLLTIVTNGNAKAHACQLEVSYAFLLRKVVEEAQQAMWTYMELPRGVARANDLHQSHFKDFRASLGTGLKCPAGWCHGEHGVRLSLLELTSNEFVYFICAFQITGLPSSMGGTRIWAYCKRLEPVLDQQWTDPRFELPAVIDSMDRDLPRAYRLVDPSSIRRVWSLVPVRGVSDEVGDPQAFYGINE